MTIAEDRYEISADPARVDAALVHHWLSTDAYWALGRPRAVQDAAIAASLNFGAYDKETGTQVACARVVTDHATFAWLCDVYVTPPPAATASPPPWRPLPATTWRAWACGACSSRRTTRTGCTRRWGSSRWRCRGTGCHW